MARIQTYTVDTTLNSGDMIIGTDGAQGANYATKNFTVGDLRTFILESVSAYTNDNVDTHLNVSSAESSQVLSWNGSDYTWVTQSSGSSFSGNYNDLTNTPTLISGSGSSGVLTKWTGTGSLGSSIVSETASTLTVGGVDNAKIVLGNTNSTNTNNRIEGLGQSGKTFIQFGFNQNDGGDEYQRIKIGYNGGAGDYNFISASVEEENNPADGIKSGSISIGSGLTNFVMDDIYLNAFDTRVSGRLQVSGTGQSSFTGQVTIPETPVAATDAASKAYVDANSGISGTASSHASTTAITEIRTITQTEYDAITTPDSDIMYVII